MIQFIILGVVGLLSGICASMGIGGGFVLLIYLTVIANVPQLQAQLINLLFFIPVAVLSVILHKKNNLIKSKAVFPSVSFGILGAIIGIILAGFLNGYKLSKLFAILIIIVGIKELFSSPQK